MFHKSLNEPENTKRKIKLVKNPSKKTQFPKTSKNKKAIFNKIK
jgi:hypothetical protein